MSMQPETMPHGLVPVEACNQLSRIEFEMAYQARVASDRIQFAIKHIERFAQFSEQGREFSMQLLDALDQLDELDRQFQTRPQMAAHPRYANRVQGES